jgi:hypothetical protein
MDYQLVIESEPNSSCLYGAITHRFYLEAVNPTDKISAVFGNDQQPLVITAPGGVYNDGMSSSWNGSGIDPIFINFFPCLQFDSYATIGQAGPEIGAGGSPEDPLLIQDSSLSPTISEFFTIDTYGQFIELNVNTLTGASIYISNTASNAMPDADGRWFIMQITSADDLQGRLNFQIFPFGVGSEQITLTRHFFTSLPCDDPYACNFNPDVPIYYDGEVDCDYSCCPGPGCCGDGTTWDSESQTCLTTYLHDADFDGCVGLSDLLSLLSVFGSCLEE